MQLTSPPRSTEEANLSLTHSITLLRASYSCLWSSIYLQVVHNCEHGFSKRFNPTGVYNFTHTRRPSLNATRFSSPLMASRQRVVDQDLYLTSTYSMSDSKRSKPTIARWPFSDVEPFVAWRGCFNRGSTSGNPCCVHVCMHRFANVLHTHAYAE